MSLKYRLKSVNVFAFTIKLKLVTKGNELELWIASLTTCVVPENIQTPTTEGIGNSRGVGGSEAQEIPEGRWVGP